MPQKQNATLTGPSTALPGGAPGTPGGREKGAECTLQGANRHCRGVAKYCLVLLELKPKSSLGVAVRTGWSLLGSCSWPSSGDSPHPLRAPSRHTQKCYTYPCLRGTAGPAVTATRDASCAWPSCQPAPGPAGSVRLHPRLHAAGPPTGGSARGQSHSAVLPCALRAVPPSHLLPQPPAGPRGPLCTFLMFLSSLEDSFFISEREKERERGREREGGREEGRGRSIDVTEKHPLIASHSHPDWGSHTLRPGIEPATLHLLADTPTN